MSETAFKLGDVVETSKGAKFWGRIVSLDDDPDSHPGATVMAIHPEFDGVKHVYPLKQLRLREDATPSLPASAEGGEAIDFVQELYSELRHQVNNCPVCKGEGMAVGVFDVLTKPEPREKTPCNRCSRARSLLDRVKPALKAEDSLHG